MENQSVRLLCILIFSRPLALHLGQKGDNDADEGHEPVVKVVQVLVHVVELLELQKLEGDLQVASLIVLPDPEEGPIANKRHVVTDPVSKFCLGAHSVEIFLENQTNEHDPETKLKRAVPECRG